MSIKYGTSRLAICFPKLGVVVKLPIVRPISFLKCTYSAITFAIKYYRFESIKSSLWLTDEYDTMGNIRYTLLNGIYQNWQEYRLWKRTTSTFLEPTYFSLLGLANVQKYGEELDVSVGTLWSQIMELSEQTAWSNGHHFSDPANFSYRADSIRMLDYGGRGIAEVVEKYGVIIAKSFDPEKKPDWEE